MKFYSLNTCLLFFNIIQLFHINCARHYRHSKEELSLTKVVKIPQNKCKENETLIVIHSAARSSGKYFDRRQVTRNTWAKVALNNSMKVMFVIGLPEDRNTQEELEEESDKYNDIIQFGFNDNYYNLTLKAIAYLRWISKNCMSSKYILKTDDDVLVNVQRFKSMVDDREFRRGMTGRIINTNSNRAFGHKWFMPEKYYPRSHYTFLWGFSYVMSSDVAKKLYRTISRYTGPVLDIDDLFITGVMADKAKIRKYDSSMFGRYCGLNACHMHDMLVFHGCDLANNTQLIWKHWKRYHFFECDNHWNSNWNNFWEN